MGRASTKPKSTAVGGLGSLSKRYESSGNPGTIANNSGDIGGASYGTYQIATNTGSMKNFMNYIQKSSPETYKALSGKSPGTQAFDTAWKQLAARDPQGFNKVQHDFIANQYYTPAVSGVRKSTGLDVSKRPQAVQDALWSTAVQHGVGGANNIFKAAGITPMMSDAEIIRRVYAERGANNGMKYFKSSSPQIRSGVVNRFRKEQQDALNMLR